MKHPQGDLEGPHVPLGQTVHRCMSEAAGRQVTEHRSIPQRSLGITWQESIKNKTHPPGVSLVAQWLRICLPMQGTRVRALVWEDPTCRGATRPVSHNY